MSILNGTLSVCSFPSLSSYKQIVSTPLSSNRGVLKTDFVVQSVMSFPVWEYW